MVPRNGTPSSARGGLAPTRPEDSSAHVLHDPEYRHVEASERRDAASSIAHGDLLRRGHHDPAGERHELRNAELGIPRPGGRSTTR